MALFHSYAVSLHSQLVGACSDTCRAISSSTKTGRSCSHRIVPSYPLHNVFVHDVGHILCWSAVRNRGYLRDKQTHEMFRHISADFVGFPEGSKEPIP